ncbi:MAG: pneumococcal-type histidine triad protein [Rhodothermaceae bacterium]|nr:pneumococcal-type histidine triad protein [Rhodothermaceae bacterium]
MGPFTVRRWLVLVFFAALVLILMQPILDPYGEKGYMEISHGDHTHYVPRDRDPNVTISNFPTSPPGPNERILPNGQVVSK